MVTFQLLGAGREMLALIGLSHYRGAKLNAIWVTLILGTAAFGFLTPVVAGRRAKHHAKKARAASDLAIQAKERSRAQVAQQHAGPAFGVFLGYDGRLSTSKTMAALWTLVVAYILVALILVSPSSWSTALKHLNWTYFSLLGGPYAALALAKAAVSYRVNNGVVQKTSGDGVPRLSDLVGDDSGRPDLFDVQYVMFNVIAMAFVLRAFWGATLAGFPVVPSGLVLLTGGPAAVYLSNKVLGSNKGVILTVSPSVVRPGGPFTIYGQNFAPDSTSSGGAPAAPQVEIGGQTATVSAGWTNSAVPAVAPLQGVAMNVPLGVGVITTSGQRAYLDSVLTVAGPPRVDGADKQSAKAGDPVTLSGEWSLTGGPTVVVTVDGVVAQLMSAANAGAVTFIVPQLTGPFSRVVAVVVIVGGQQSNAAQLEVTS